MNRIKKFLLYGDTDRESYMQILPDIIDSNRTNLIVFSVVEAIAMGLLYFASFFVDSLEKNATVYMCCLLACLIVVFFVWRIAIGRKRLIYICMYLFTMQLYMFGVALGTFIEPDEISGAFLVMLYAVPLMFTDVPIRVVISNAVGMILYYICAKHTQTSVILEYNMTNVIPFGFISMILGSYMMKTKIGKNDLQNEVMKMVKTDKLTGLYNRHCFELNVQKYRDNGCDEGLLICQFDVNGLKRVNDFMGHLAGDELIRSAADCINSTFGDYGFCYRTGGDEFIAILDRSELSPSELTRILNKRCAEYKGKMVNSISVSTGIIQAKKGESFDKLLKLADQAMYADKELYYEKVGNRRRR